MKRLVIAMYVLFLTFSAIGFGFANLQERKFGFQVVEKGEANLGIKPAIALDNRGFVHISYYDRTNSFIKYANNVSGNWENNEIVDTIRMFDDDFDDYDSDIVIDRDGKAHIAYFSKSLAGSNLYYAKYATNKNGEWETYQFSDSTVAPRNMGIALALDSSDSLYAIYMKDRSDPTLVKREADRWTFVYELYSGLDSGPFALAFDSTDKAHMLTCVYNTFGWDFETWYYTYKDGTRTKQKIDSLHQSDTGVAIAVDSSDRPQIAIANAGSDKIEYGYLNELGNYYSNFKLSGLKPSIAIDPEDTVFIVGDVRTSRYVTNANGLFNIASISANKEISGPFTFSFEGISGQEPDLAIGPFGIIHIAYYNKTNRTLDYCFSPPVEGIIAGALRVFLNPSEAMNAGAQWRVDGGAWQNSGATISPLSVGSHKLEFKPLAGWASSGIKNVAIVKDKTTVVQETYTLHTGKLKVDITPGEAISAGAKWRINQGVWQDSGTILSSIPIGSKTVEYMAVAGWDSPATTAVDVLFNQTSQLTGQYLKQEGSLSVEITPVEAREAGARWQMDGGAWQDSGATLSNIPVGSHIVTFDIVNGWDAPANVVIVIKKNQSTSVKSTYIQNTGWLKVSIIPGQAVSRGARWRLDGGEWQESETTLSELMEGDHLVFFNQIAGWDSPPSQNITVVRGQTSFLTGTYVVHTGQLQVKILPENLPENQWRINGGAWQNNGVVLPDLAVGEYQLEFKNIAGWVSPEAEIIAIAKGVTKKVNRTYASIEEIKNVSEIAAGFKHFLILRKDNSVWSWGLNSAGQLGDGTFEEQQYPVRVAKLINIKAISAGASYSVALDQDGSVWAWGKNNEGQLGIGNNQNQSLPQKVHGLPPVIGIAAGASHIVALVSDGAIWAWGGNDHGQLGIGSNMDQNKPVKISYLSGIQKVVAGAGYTIALKKDGTIWAWGKNDDGQLGDGSLTDSQSPVEVKRLPRIESIACGENYSIALDTDGGMWGWGANYYGQLGSDSTTTPSVIPLEITSFSGHPVEATGYHHTLALDQDNFVWAFGDNYESQCGTPGSAFLNKIQETPFKVDISDCISVAAGYYNSLALKKDGTIWMWGNFYLIPGITGFMGDQANPVQVIKGYAINGDINGDQKVDVNDSYAGLKLLTLQGQTVNSLSDTNANGFIDLNDVVSNLQQVKYISD